MLVECLRGFLSSQQTLSLSRPLVHALTMERNEGGETCWGMYMQHGSPGPAITSTCPSPGHPLRPHVAQQHVARVREHQCCVSFKHATCHVCWARGKACLPK